MDPFNIEDFTPAYAASLMIGAIIHLRYGNRGQCVERFICTVAGRFTFWVSLDYGYAYTRPQLVDKYSKVGAVGLVERSAGKAG